MMNPASDPPRDIARELREILREWLTPARRAEIGPLMPEQKGLFRAIPGTHYHLCHELFFQVSGTSFFAVPDGRFTMPPGRLVVMPRGLPHSERVQRGSVRNLCVILEDRRMIRAHIGEGRNRRPGTDVQCTPPVRFTSSSATRVWEYTADLVDLAAHTSAGAQERRLGALQALLGGLLDICEGEALPPPDEPLRVSRAKELVLEWLASPELSVQTLAEELGCTADHLSTLFHRSTGQRLNAFINGERLAYARHLLRHTALNISEVASATGYEDAGYFARRFRREVGLSPRAYRLAGTE